MSEEKAYLRQQNTDLINRIQAADFKTYAALSTGPAEVLDYPAMHAKTDIAELQALAQANGLGIPIYDDESDDDELRDTFVEFGIQRSD